MRSPRNPEPQGPSFRRKLMAAALALVAVVALQTHTYDSQRDGSRVWTVDVVTGEVIVNHGVHYCQWGEC